MFSYVIGLVLKAVHNKFKIKLKKQNQYDKKNFQGLLTSIVL